MKYYTLKKHIWVNVFLYSGHDDPSREVIASARLTFKHNLSKISSHLIPGRNFFMI